IKLYLPKSMKSYKKITCYRNDDSTYIIYAFDETCKGCRMYVKKKSPLAKYFDKNKVKYKTY
ncbi:MAG: hypothetical protein K2K09_03875, partial [Lachnospiraceae bacterium]|nr:hypothetical protein [Lachnospiraceae bacterium]